MPNALFNALGNNSNGNNNNNPVSAFNNLINNFNQFRSAFKGNPVQEVQRLLNTGEMTQEQYDQLNKTAAMFINILPK